MGSAAGYQQSLQKIIDEVIAPSAAEVDQVARFPSAAIDAMSKAGLLALISAKDVGGMGEGTRAASYVVEKIAEACGSTAMVVCMYYSATAVIEKYGSDAVRRDIAAGEFSPGAIATGFDKVQRLKDEMAQGRELRLNRLGFRDGESTRLAHLHTRNFM